MVYYCYICYYVIIIKITKRIIIFSNYCFNEKKLSLLPPDFIQKIKTNNLWCNHNFYAFFAYISAIIFFTTKFGNKVLLSKISLVTGDVLFVYNHSTIALL